MITDHHGMMRKNLFQATSSLITTTTTTTTTTTGIFIVSVGMGNQFVMNVRISQIYCNRNVNSTIVFLILIYWRVG